MRAKGYSTHQKSIIAKVENTEILFYLHTCCKEKCAARQNLIKTNFIIES